MKALESGSPPTRSSARWFLSAQVPRHVHSMRVARYIAEEGPVYQDAGIDHRTMRLNMGKLSKDQRRSPSWIG